MQRYPSLVFFAFVAALTPLSAQSSQFIKKAGLWEAPESWSLKAVPGVGNLAVVGSGKTATVSADVGRVSIFYIGGEKAPSCIILAPGGKLSTDGGGLVGRNLGGTEGSLILAGGELYMGTGTGSRLLVGASATVASKGVAIFRSGTFTGSLFVGSGTPDKGKGVLIIDGSRPVLKQDTKKNYLSVQMGGTLQFNLDAAGVASLSFPQGTASFSKGAVLVVDASAYKGGPGNFPLVKAARLQDEGLVFEYKGFPQTLSPRVKTTPEKGEITLHISATK